MGRLGWVRLHLAIAINWGADPPGPRGDALVPLLPNGIKRLPPPKKPARGPAADLGVRPTNEWHKLKHVQSVNP